MEKAGVLDDCDACDDCMEAAAKLSPEDVARLPLPGEAAAAGDVAALVVAVLSDVIA
jgi:hypothetical protein